MPDRESEKKALRAKFLEIRKNLSDKHVEQNSSRIQQRVLQSKEFKNASTVHTYISIKKNKEVGTYTLIEICLAQGKKVVVPKIAPGGMLNHLEISSIQNLRENKLGIPEPVRGKDVSKENLDLIFVPMVAGDRFKNRLGYGMGYYDRFLNGCNALKMGLLFDCQLYEKKLPVESFDIPLDILVTESERIEC